MSFELHDAVLVMSDISTSATYLATKKVAGKTFFAVRKVDRKLQRLLLGDAFQGGRTDRPLAHTTIIDKIRVARDAAIRSRLGGKKGTRFTKDQKAKLLILEDTFADIEVIGYSLRTVVRRGALLVELPVPNLEWLTANLKDEIESGAVWKRHVRATRDARQRFESADLKGRGGYVTACYTDDAPSALRVRKRDAGGKMRNKDIKLSKGEAKARRKAEAFLRDSDTDTNDEGTDVETEAQNERADREREEGHGGDEDIMKGQGDEGIHNLLKGKGHGGDGRCIDIISSDGEGDDGQGDEDVEVDAEMRDAADGSL